MILRVGETIQVKQPDLILDETAGFRRVMCGTQIIAQEGETDMAWAARLALQIRELQFDAAKVPHIAHLGGGFGIVARLLGPSFKHTFYEIEPAFLPFIEPMGSVVVGDWRKTYKKGADIVIYDTFGEPFTDADLEAVHPAIVIK